MADALDLPALLQAGFGGGLLVWLYVRLLMHHRQDRAEGRQTLTALRREHAAELAAARARIAELEKAVDVARRRQWKAEDAAAQYRRQLGLPPLRQGVDGGH